MGEPFQAHLDLLQLFLARRGDIVENIQDLLNAQRKPAEQLQDHSLVHRHFEDCFFTLTGVTDSQRRLRGRLDEAHHAAGFEPRDLPGLHNALVDPAEMAIRVFHLWQQTRWPGRNGRVRYAHTLFNLYLVRSLALLTMRLWDESALEAAARLAEIQNVLDMLWTSAPPDQPVLVRDARWLIQLAQSPATDDLGAYFAVARNIAESLPPEDRMEIHKAGVCMTAGHLRSQLHYYAKKKVVSIDEPGLVLNTRTTNALDYGLLIQELVPLLDEYERALDAGDETRRLTLANAICQGISPDPDLFVNRVELLGAYSMIEHLFITTNEDGGAAYTPTGQRHAGLVQEYEARIGRVVKPLSEDCLQFRPVAGSYSPYGVVYGFSSDLLEHMALKASQADAATGWSLEDVFADGDEAKLAWVTGWRKLPHVTPDVQKLFAYPQLFADEVFARIERALRARAADDEEGSRPRTGRLFIQPGDDPESDPKAPQIENLPVHYINSSDRRLVSNRQAEFHVEQQLLADRHEGRCLLSYRTPGGWVAISKAVLTDVLGTGRNVRIAKLPSSAVGSLTLMCRDLVVLPDNTRAAP